MQQKDFLLGHLVLSEHQNEFANSIIVLSSIIPKFNELFASCFGEECMERAHEISIKNFSEEKLRFFPETRFQKMIFDEGMANTEFSKQEEILFDFEKIEAKLEKKLKRKLVRVQFDKDSIKKFKEVGENESIGETIEKFQRLRGSENSETSGYTDKLREFSRRLDYIEKSKLVEFYNVLVFVMQKNKKKTIDSELTLGRFIKKKKLFLLWDFSKMEMIKLKDVYPLFEKIESKIVTEYFIPRLNPIYQNSSDELDKPALKNLIIKVDKQHRVQLQNCLVSLFARHSNSLTMDSADYLLKDYIPYSPVSDKFEPISEEDRIINLLNFAGLKLKNICYLFDLLKESNE